MKTTKPRVWVELNAYWCYADAGSSIKISRRRWKAIQAGAVYNVTTWYWYEGERHPAEWSFANGKFAIDGEDAAQRVVLSDVSELVANEEQEYSYNYYSYL